MTLRPAEQIFFVDISELVQGDSQTGIQRVVRSIVSSLLANGVVGFRVEFIYAVKGKPYRYARRYLQRLLGTSGTTTVEDCIDPQAGDVFLGLDFQDTIVPSQANFLQEIRARGVKVYFVVYDLLPIQLSSYFATTAIENHTAWLNTITQADGAICISQSVSIELAEWLQSNLPILRKPFDIGWFHLGANVEASQPSRGLAADAADTLRSLVTRPTFLLVGTIEPRKGQAQVFYAFRKLWASGLDVNLVMVGKQGWLVEDLVAELNVSPELGRRLFWLNAISDEFLAKVYAASTCLIAASEGEGFGLPLVEAAQHKLPIIARDIPVFREVAGTHAFYFAGLQASALADAVVEWLALYKSGRYPRSDDMPTLTWSQSTAQLVDIVLNNKWSAHWTSSGSFFCAGSDRRLKTQVGIKRKQSIETTGIAGLLFYGPYIALPAGGYQIRIYGEVKNLDANTFQVEATAQFGNKILSSHVLEALRKSGLIAAIDISLPTAITEFEVRLMVSRESDMLVDKLEISMQTPVAIGAREVYLPQTQEQSKGDNFLRISKSEKMQNIDLQELLTEEGEEFIEAAFMALLKRRPDANGGRTYLRAMRNGTSKLQILYEIANSSECRIAGGDIPGLAEACTREGITETGDKPPIEPPPQASQIKRAEQLLVFGDADKFIEIAYWVLLKRPPDAAGIANCQARLQDGASKAQILHELFTSPESREIGVELPGLRDAFAREGLHVVDDQISAPPEQLPTAAKTLEELLGHQGGRFVECAYLTLLARAPDSQGFQHRLAQLLDGCAKIQILSEMSASNEAMTAAVNLPGLSAAIARYRFSQTPIIGRLAKLFVRVEGNSPAERRGRAAEQRLITLEAELDERLAQLEKSGIRAAGIEQQSHAAREDVDARIASLERSVAGLRQLVDQSARKHPISAALSVDAASTQSSSRLALDLRAEEVARDLRRRQ